MTRRYHPNCHLLLAHLCLAIITFAYLPAAVSLALVTSADLHRADSSNYKSLLLSPTTSFLDVRAPVEHRKGSFPSSTNLPILSDEEHALVGACYKKEGSEAAIALGTNLVSGSTKESRIASWVEYARLNPTGSYLFCFRGGLRSQTAQLWIHESTNGQVSMPIVIGGAKAMRKFLIDELETNVERSEFVVVRGETGSGKTRIMDALGEMRSLDLEGTARHRGSAFGRMPECPDQISQVDFENGLSISLMRLLDASDDNGVTATKPVRVYVEDESHRIGTVTIPPPLFHKMSTCESYVTVTATIEERIDNLVDDYVVDLRRRYVALYGTELGPKMHRDRMIGDLKRIRKGKFGGKKRHAELVEMMVRAFDEFDKSMGGDTGMHREWIGTLLKEYYDPMYQHQAQAGKGEELFRGSQEEVIKWALEENA